MHNGSKTIKNLFFTYKEATIEIPLKAEQLESKHKSQNEDQTELVSYCVIIFFFDKLIKTSNITE